MDLTLGEKQALAQKIQRLEFPDVMHIVSLIHGGRDPATLPESALEIDIATLSADTLAAVHAFVNRERESDEGTTRAIPSPKKKKRQTILAYKLSPPPAVSTPRATKKGKKQTTLTRALTLSGTPPAGAEPRHTCEICHKAFKRANVLKEHRVSHDKSAEGNPFRCPTCARPMSNAANLARHMRTHTGERPYVCMHCGASFTQSGNCKVHEFKCGGSTTRVKHAGKEPPAPDMVIVPNPPKKRNRSAQQHGE